MTFTENKKTINHPIIERTNYPTNHYLPSMNQKNKIRTTIVGCGGMARHHVRNILANFPDTEFPVLCEPSPEMYAKMAQLYLETGQDAPPNEPDLNLLLTQYGDQLDAAFIVTPHIYHHDQAKACMEAGLDVLLEKPMVMNAAEAHSLIETQYRTGTHLVVAFQSSLSPHIQAAARMLRNGELGDVLNINALVWQSWCRFTDDTWRQQPEVSGGGFLFDTGAHMLNTVTYLAGEDFKEVAAWFDYRERPVDILTAAIGKLKSGTLVTLNGCGDTIPSCSSDVRVFCTEGILKTGVWGGSLEVQYSQDEGWLEIEVPPSRGSWEQFLLVRDGSIPNPSPPEIGLRMAHLWDAIKASAEGGGVIVKIQ
jgi:predicted dehydrogenase